MGDLSPSLSNLQTKEKPMKKTLTLLALLMIAGPQAMAETTTFKEHWMVGVKCSYPTDPYYMDYRRIIEDNTAYTFTKDQADTYATNQCWAASAADTLAWWEDQTEANGALIMNNAPRGVELWKTLSPMFTKSGGYQYYAMSYWLWGEMPNNTSEYLVNPDPNFKGYFNHLDGKFWEYSKDYRMIKTVVNGSTTVKIDNDPDCMREAQENYWEREKQLVSMIDEGWGVTFYTDTEAHAMSIFGVDTDEDGHITRLWYTDNNPGSVFPGQLVAARSEEEFVDTPERQKYRLKSYLGNYGSVSQFYLIRTTGIHFDTYELSFDGVDDEPLFSHYLNVTYDGGEHTLQYDLRNAQDEGSPVEAVSNTGEKITTGNITLKDGKLSLIACEEGREALDGGGKTSGTITFEAKEGTTRTLSVQHTDTIAKEIKINAADGNTLEVTEGKTATFGTLSGTGDLDKKGLGAAKVTDAVELKGEIRVKEGDFIFGKDVELTGNTKLTVSEGARVQGAEGKAITLTIDSGVHINDGVMALTTTVKTGATLKGSGTFAMVTIDGGEMIVGNSPGHQEFTDTLTLNRGKIVFCASGLENASAGDNTGWASETYSTINMGGQDLLIDPNGEIVVSLGGALLEELAELTGDFSLTLATEVGNTQNFDGATLLRLAGQTTFSATDELAAKGAIDPSSRIGNLAYALQGSNLVLTGTLNGGNVPEPATGTLSLLALAGLCARRRRK